MASSGSGRTSPLIQLFNRSPSDGTTESTLMKSLSKCFEPPLDEAIVDENGIGVRASKAGKGECHSMPYVLMSSRHGVASILPIAIAFHVHLFFNFHVSSHIISFIILYITFHTSLLAHQLNINGDHQFQSRTAMKTIEPIKIKSHQCLPALQGHSYSNHPNKPPSQNPGPLTTPTIPITRILQNQPPWGPIHKALRPIPMLPRWRQAMAASGTSL